MSFISWANSKIKKLDYFDIGFIKFGTVAFTLMIAKLWEPLLSLEWYWYGLLFLLMIIRPWYKVVIKK